MAMNALSELVGQALNELLGTILRKTSDLIGRSLLSYSRNKKSFTEDGQHNNRGSAARSDYWFDGVFSLEGAGNHFAAPLRQIERCD